MNWLKIFLWPIKKVILTTHSIVGSAIAKVVTINPALAFAAAMGSHYILDSLPHWEYELRSAKPDSGDSLNNDMVLGEDFIFDLFKIGADFFFGLFLSFLFFYDPNQPASLFIVLAGVAGGVMPDFLQFFYMKLRCEPFALFQKIHDFFHTTLKLKNNPYLNVIIQLSLIAVSFAVGNFL